MQTGKGKKERRADQRDKKCGWDEGIVNNIEENNKISIEKDYNGNWCFSLAERRRETFAQVL